MSAQRPTFVMTTLTAFVAADENGDEGLVAMHTGSGWTPLVAADQSRVESLLPHAQKIADATGQAMRIVRFTVREDVGHVTPRKGARDDG